MTGSQEYAELQVVTNFSFLRGASSPEELVKQAIALGYKAIAITDECSVAGIVRAYNESHDKEKRTDRIQLIIGSEFWVDESVMNERALRCVLIAPTREAYTELCTFITAARRQCPKGEYKVSIDDFKKIQRCLAIWLPHQDVEKNIQQGKVLQGYLKDRLWVGVGLFREEQDLEHYHLVYHVAAHLNLPMVACNNVHMHVRERKQLQDLVTAIRLNTPVGTLGNQLFQNSERRLRTLDELQLLYPQALLDETIAIARRCKFKLEELKYQYPRELVPDNYKPIEYLRMLTEKGAEERYPKGVPIKVKVIIDKELELIEKMSYEYYFLTVYDIVFFARSQNIFCQGRGSAANSAVCFCLGITSVNPDQVGLLFERFISEERDEPPDIDVDFEHERREEVIQYIYQKYTREKTALTATVITYRTRSAIRDVGKAIGLDQALIDQLAKSLAWWDRKNDLYQRFEENQVSRSAEVAHYFFTMVHEILGFPRHLSQHVGGFLIADLPVSSFVPIENAAMEDRTVIQWDKVDIESLGLLKVDVLGLGMLTAIRKTFEYMRRYDLYYTDLYQLPKEDPETYDMLCDADTVGVFQVESRAQMSMLPRLRPRCYYDLVIEIAIVRPGPIQGDMVHPYLKRRNGEERVDYKSPELESVLKKTLGVPIFQEQVIQISMVAAGFSGGQADQLRRAMASWGRNGHLEPFKKELIEGMLSRGYQQEFAERLYEQIKGFGNYGFPESHSASFALIAYASAYLKKHHTAAFTCGLLNSLPMGFYGPPQLIQDAQRHGVIVLSIDIDFSGWNHQLEMLNNGGDVNDSKNYGLRLGMRLIKGLSRSGVDRLLNARAESAFQSIKDLQCRAGLNRADMSALASANAYPRFSDHRYQAHWDALSIEESKPLLSEYERGRSLVEDEIQLTSPSDVDNTLADYASFGLTLGRHPLDLLRSEYPFYQCKKASQLPKLRHKQSIKVAGVVTCRQRPGSAAGVLFLTLEDETGCINVVVWKNTQIHFREALIKGKLLFVKGILEKDAAEGKVVHVIAGYIENQTERLEDLRSVSRDFH